jgi:hypothetical protein
VKPSRVLDDNACAAAAVLDKEELVKLLVGERLSKPILSLDDEPHAAMYLTMDVESESMQDKVGRLVLFNESLYLMSMNGA